MTTVRLRDGIRIETEEGRLAVADATEPDGVPLLSHAHGDHLYGTAPEAVVGSALTRELAGVRRDGPVPDGLAVDWIESVPAGHIPGSRAFLLKGEKRVLYTGDCSVRDRFGMTGFDPPSADVLILESTYGKPGYTFPDQGAVEAEIVDWLEDTMDRPVVLLGYALGRAQELLRLAERAGRDRIRYTPGIGALNEPIEAATGRPFPGAVASGFEPEPGDVSILPSQMGGSQFVEGLRAEQDALVAGFSGWAVDSGYRYARDLDRAFVLSDHCDFTELLGIVEAVDPEQVSTVHGFVEEFAAEIQSRLGVPAQALKADQRTLGEFQA